VDTFGTDLAISTERTAVSDTAAIAEANSLFILCSSSCSPKLRTAASRHERPFHNGSLCEIRNDGLFGIEETRGSRTRNDYEFVIEFQNALGRLYIRYLNPPLG
jgi:hypothetical protein